MSPTTRSVGTTVNGLYVLRLELREDLQLTVGALGAVQLRPGDYLYVGSARRGLEQRVGRHLRKEKPLHWHIDYLTSQPSCEVASAVLFPHAPFSECALCRELQQRLDATVPVRGFGASDCRAGCGAHLVRLPRHAGDAEIRAAGANLESALHQRQP